jgi:hypothetical protein
MPGDEIESFNLEHALLNEETSSGDDKGAALATDPTKAGSLRDTLSRGESKEVTSAEDDDPDGDQDDLEDDDSEGDDDEKDTIVPDQEQKPAGFDVFAAAKQHGLDLTGKYESPEKAFEGLIHAARMVGQRSDLAEYGKRLLEDPKGVYEYLQKQFAAEQKTPETPAAEKKPASDRPEFNEEWLDQFDEAGKFIGSDATIPAKLQKFQKWRADKISKLALDPENTLLPLFETKLKEMAKKEAAELVAKARGEDQAVQYQARLVNEARSLVSEEADWVCVNVPEVHHARRAT